MNFSDPTIENFFAGKKSYEIPPYQRAYSWGKEQLDTFIDDLCECQYSNLNNPYYLGNIMAEKINDNKYEIIDGQQRLTTIIIFIRALLNESEQRKVTNENISINQIEEERTFFRDYGIIKLTLLNFDQSCFNTVIIENNDNYKCETPSQRNIVFAKKFFQEKLNKIDLAKIENLLSVLKNSKINFISLEGKKDSALMFELQNNRGKALTTLEKIKSFLMYQLYIYSPTTSTDTDINYLSEKFASIYGYTSKIEEYARANTGTFTLTEDDILIYHSYAYSKKNFNYRNLSDIIDEYKSVDTIQKVSWIKKYVDELYLTFANIQEFMIKNKNENLIKLKKLKMPFFIYPFIIKSMKYFKEDEQKMESMYECLEKLSFRYKLVNSRSDIRGKLNDLIKNFDDNVSEFRKQLKTTMEDAYYWSDARIIETLNGNMYKNDDITNYLLWEYEATLQCKGYKIGDLTIENESLEHISPQTADEEWVESGYEVNEKNQYSDDFRQNYLNKLGNLMLISQSHNSQIGNKPFKNKLESYNNPILKQQSEIKDFVEDMKDPIWDSKAIDKRHEKIINWAKQRWSL